MIRPIRRGVLLFAFLLAAMTAMQAQQPCTPSPEDPTKCAAPTPQPTPPTITNTQNEQQFPDEQTGVDQQRDQDRGLEQGQREPRKETGEPRREETKPVPAEPPRPRRPLPPNPFAEFVRNSTGKNLPQFGFTVFEQLPTTFAPVDEVPVTSDYVIGPDDEIVVRAWGQLDVNYRSRVDRSGRIFLPKVGEIMVAGLRSDELEGRIHDAIARNYHDFQLSVSLGRLRSIRIFVVGRSFRPGAYTVSSMSTVINAVLASGGPTPNGSLRRVQLKRGDKVVSEVDFYDLLVRGDKSKDVHLLPGDVIYIPPVGPQVAVLGAVAEPAIYEIKDEKTMGDLVKLVGGLPNVAEASKARVERVVDARMRQVAEIALSGEGLTQPIRDGDVVTVFPVSYKFENAVTLRGSVARAGRYPWKPEMRVKDLIPNAEFLVTQAVWVARNNASTPAGVKPELSPAINWSYASIDRIDPTDLTSKLVPFDLRKAIDGDPEQNKLLEPGDIITIYTQSEIRSSIGQRAVFVRVDGEVVSPGLYQALPGEHLRAFVARVAKQLTPQAYLFGAQFTRDAVRRQQQLNIEKTARTLELERPVRRRASSTGTSGTSAEAAQQLAQDEERDRQQMIARVRSIQPTGRIVLALNPNSDGFEDLPDFELQDGDVLSIPVRPATVSVFGSVYNGADFSYSPKRTVGDYLRMAGGPTRSADRSRMYVLRADGGVKGGGSRLTGGVERYRLMPGDSIFVPEKLEQGPTFGESFRNWSTAIGQLGLSAAALKVLMQ